jgi:hypothetical protein
MSQARVCHPYITGAGLPHRTAAILRRERTLYAAAATDLVHASATDAVDGEAVDEEPAVDEPVVTMDQLEAVFATHSATAMPSAAFVAGRCQPDDPADARAIDELLRTYLRSLDARRLDSAALGFVQAAMSLALRGDIDTGRQALRAVLADDAAGSMADALAIACLAQLGDPSGFAKLAGLLGSGDAYTRLMAARQLGAFAAWDGSEIAGQRVELAKLLTPLVDDPDELVAREIPALLADLGSN